MDNLKNVHIVGIGGCASSAIAEYLADNGVNVSGSEMKPRSGLEYLESKNVKIFYSHNENNIHYNGKPDIVLFSPAIIALNPDNPEIVEAKKLNIKCESWEEFIGNYLSSMGKIGITVSGSEGKGTTAGILTAILKDTEYDPLSILGAKLKNINNNEDSNIYIGKGKSYILEGDEYNRNFHSYHPEINVMINFEFEHPETYKDFDDYSDSFATFFKNMKGGKKLILHSTKKIREFVDKYGFSNITWFGFEDETAMLTPNSDFYTIKEHCLTEKGNRITLLHSSGDEMSFDIPALPGYIALNGTGAILAAIELGLDKERIKTNLKRFVGMVRRFDVYKSRMGGVLITDYGHSPESIRHIICEIRNIFSGRKLHIVFHPHLFSRTANFFNEFAVELAKADRISLLDIYPARENPDLWAAKVSSQKLAHEIAKTNPSVFYAGAADKIYDSLLDKIDENEVTCFIGAGNMDLYYGKILESLGCTNWF